MLSEFFVNFTLQGTQQWPEPQFLNRMLKQKIKNDLRQYRIILSADTASEVQNLRKAQIILMSYRAFWQRRCRAA